MPRPGRMTTERAKDFKGTLLQLVRNLGRYRLSLVTAIVFAILSTIFNIAGPKVLAKATTALATGWIAKLRGTGSIDFVYIGRILLFLDPAGRDARGRACERLPQVTGGQGRRQAGGVCRRGKIRWGVYAHRADLLERLL